MPRSRPGPPRRPVRPAIAGLVLVVTALLGLASPATATWSIVAVDGETGLVGAAMASCIPAEVLGNPDEALVPVVLVPGRAAAVTQGAIDPMAPARLRDLLEAGVDPGPLVDEIIADDVDAELRQYAVVTAAADDGAPLATHTGDGVSGEAGSAGETDAGPGGDRVSAQGVLLADADLPDLALDAFVAAREAGAGLDRALVDALLAGAEVGGDRRCPEEQTALFAHLAVAEADDDGVRPSLLLTVLVDEGDGQNPVVLLDRYLEEGRTGWVDVGTIQPSGLPVAAVLVVAALLGIGAFVAIRRGLGSPSARR